MTKQEAEEFVHQRIFFITHKQVTDNSGPLGHGGAGMDAVAIEGLVERSNNYIRAHGGRETIGDDDGVAESTTVDDFINLVWKKIQS
jgi:hypothetical protein